MFPVVILAGGLATRLRPITETIPKSLVDVAGKPFIVRQLSYLREQGISRVVLCIGYLGDMVREAVGSGESFGLEVSYSEDGPNLLGTGGALAKAIPLLGNDFFVLYGDSFLPVNFSVAQRAYEQSRQPALMTVFKNQNKWDKSNVLFVGGRIREYNKRAPQFGMNYIDYGLGVIRASLLKQRLVGQSFDLADVYEDLSLQGQLAGLEVNQRFYEIGSHAGLKETEDYFLSKE
jgi:NDP-sugar pyrophosphorylase family protein